MFLTKLNDLAASLTVLATLAGLFWPTTTLSQEVAPKNPTCGITLNGQDLQICLPVRPGVRDEGLAQVVKALRRGGFFQGLGSGVGYTCDSTTNLCSCDQSDPIDCALIFEECTPHPPGRPDQVCTGTGKCECTWHE